MKILAIGEQKRFEELQSRLGAEHQYTYKPDFSDGFLSSEQLNGFDYIFDLNFDDNPANLNYYARLENVPVLVSAAKISLSEQFARFKSSVNQYNITGCNFLPTMINRPKWEVTQLRPGNLRVLAKLENELGVPALQVGDRVGMVTPRVLAMIINEGAFTVQEGTASVPDVDLGMKLGTNYPFGPLEWADRIGLQHVVDLLHAIYDDTKDERYKVCPLLKNLVFSEETFYHYHQNLA